MNDIISEDEFENLPSLPENSAVAIDNKHAYKKVVVPSQLKDPSPFQVIGKASRETSGSREASPSSVISEGKNLDKINNLAQKEISLSRVGVTREKAYKVIATALEATKWTDVVDEQGNVRRELVADLDKQRWGAEMAIKMFGDMIERKEIEYDLGDKTLDRFRAMSVADLKARAADLLLGRKGAIDAEVVR